MIRVLNDTNNSFHPKQNRRAVQLNTTEPDAQKQRPSFVFPQQQVIVGF